MLEKYFNNLNTGIAFNDLLSVIIFMLFILVIFSFLSKRKFLKKIKEIPGFEVNEALDGKINRLRDFVSELNGDIIKNNKSIDNLEEK